MSARKRILAESQRMEFKHQLEVTSPKAWLSAHDTVFGNDVSTGARMANLRVAFMLQRYEMLITRSAANRTWYFAIDAVFSIAFGVVGGIRPADRAGCYRAQISLLVISALQGAALVVLRPFGSRCDNVFKIVLAALSVASCGLLVGGRNEASDILSYVELALLGCRSCLVVLLTAQQALYHIRRSDATAPPKASKDVDSGFHDFEAIAASEFPASSITTTNVSSVPPFRDCVRDSPPLDVQQALPATWLHCPPAGAYAQTKRLSTLLAVALRQKASTNPPQPLLQCSRES